MSIIRFGCIDVMDFFFFFSARDWKRREIEVRKLVEKLYACYFIPTCFKISNIYYFLFPNIESAKTSESCLNFFYYLHVISIILSKAINTTG